MIADFFDTNDAFLQDQSLIILILILLAFGIPYLFWYGRMIRRFLKKWREKNG